MKHFQLPFHQQMEALEITIYYRYLSSLHFIIRESIQNYQQSVNVCLQSLHTLYTSHDAAHTKNPKKFSFQFV